jgi:Tol biopolymer transport system component
LVAADGTGVRQSLKCPGDYCEPTDWSADGASLLVTTLEGGDENVWLVPTDSSIEPKPLLTESYAEKDARFSPNGRWIAYVSNEAGHPEVLVHSANGIARRMTVSGEGGTQPVWQRDGKALYFVDLAGYLRSVAVQWNSSGEPSFALPQRTSLPQVGFGHWGTQYDISPDGKRIYFMEPSRDPPPREMQVAINWRSMLR